MKKLFIIWLSASSLSGTLIATDCSSAKTKDVMAAVCACANSRSTYMKSDGSVRYVSGCTSSMVSKCNTYTSGCGLNPQTFGNPDAVSAGNTVDKKISSTSLISTATVSPGVVPVAVASDTMTWQSNDARTLWNDTERYFKLLGEEVPANAYTDARLAQLAKLSKEISVKRYDCSENSEVCLTRSNDAGTGRDHTYTTYADKKAKNDAMLKRIASNREILASGRTELISKLSASESYLTEKSRQSTMKFKYSSKLLKPSSAGEKAYSDSIRLSNKIASAGKELSSDLKTIKENNALEPGWETNQRLYEMDAPRREKLAQVFHKFYSYAACIDKGFNLDNVTSPLSGTEGNIVYYINQLLEKNSGGVTAEANTRIRYLIDQNDLENADAQLGYDSKKGAFIEPIGHIREDVRGLRSEIRALTPEKLSPAVAGGDAASKVAQIQALEQECDSILQ